MFRISWVLIFLLSLFFTFSHCSRKPKGWGKDNEVRVVADSLDWVYLEDTIRGVFEKEILTPHPEKVLNIVKTDLQQFKRYKNLIMVSTLQSEGEVASVVNSILSEEVRQRVEQGINFVFNKKDVWAEDQLLMILVAPDLETLKDRLTQNQDFLFNIVDEHLNKVYKKYMYRKLEQKDIEKTLLQRYGWMLRVQHDYFIAREDPKERFVMLRRRWPERWIYVYWEDTDDPSFLTERWCLDKRKEIGVKFYENDKVLEQEDLTFVREVNFLGRRAYKIEGVWQNDEKVAGGPFRSYCFYDEPTSRVYMIDIAVFNPGKPKEFFLRQLEIIAHTFKTKEEINISDIESG